MFTDSTNDKCFYDSIIRNIGFCDAMNLSIAESESLNLAYHHILQNSLTRQCLLSLGVLLRFVSISLTFTHSFVSPKKRITTRSPRWSARKVQFLSLCMRCGRSTPLSPRPVTKPSFWSVSISEHVTTNQYRRPGTWFPDASWRQA